MKKLALSNPNLYSIKFKHPQLGGKVESDSLEQLIYDLNNACIEPDQIIFPNGLVLNWDDSLADSFANECSLSEKSFIQKSLTLNGGLN